MSNLVVFRYLHNIAKSLPCNGKQKRKIIGQIRQNVKEFIAENPSADYMELIGRFGTPQQIATAYVEEIETADIVGNMRVKRSIVKLVTVAVILALTFWLVAVTASFLYNLDQSDGTVETYIETLSDTVKGDAK